MLFSYYLPQVISHFLSFRNNIWSFSRNLFRLKKVLAIGDADGLEPSYEMHQWAMRSIIPYNISLSAIFWKSFKANWNYIKKVVLRSVCLSLIIACLHLHFSLDALVQNRESANLHLKEFQTTQAFVVIFKSFLRHILVSVQKRFSYGLR